MSLLISIPLAILFVIGGAKLNLSDGDLLIIVAIIFAGGLAGYKG